ncbi:MAG TPA: translocation/assembly module TamB domain-containing protein [Candidatus Methylomirabilis sp.]|nr:translocation/assembly module TamB domain-containing protein [Candidatus Methylomirabilis sp.]
MRRRRFWLLLGVLGFLLLTGTLAATWLAFRAYGPEFTRERIEAALSDALGRPAQIKEIQLQPWLGRVILSDIRVEGATAQESFLRLGRVEIRVGLSSIWRREVVLSRVTLEDMALHLSPDGKAAPLRSLAIPTTIPIGPVTVSLGRIQFIRGALTYDAPGGAWRVEIRDIQGTATPEADRLDLAVRAGSLWFRHGRIDQTVEALDAAAQIGAERVTVGQLAARWRGRPLRVAGEVLPLREPGTASLRVDGELDLAEVGRAVGASVSVSGIARVRGEITGDFTAPRVSGSVAIPALAAGPFRAQSVGVRGRWADGLLTLEAAEARTLDGEVRGSLTLAPDRPDASRLKLAFRQIGLPALEAILERPIGLAGQLEGEAEVAGDLGLPDSLTGRLAVQAGNLRLPEPYVRLGTGTVSAEGRLEQGALELAAAKARWPGADLTARGGLTPAGPRALRVEGEVDLGRAALLWDQRGIAGLATIDLVASGSWGRPEITGRMRLGRFTVAGTDLDEADIPFRLAGSSLEAEPTVRRGRIRLTGSGRLAWPSPPPADGWHMERDLRFQVEASAPQVPWEDLVEWLPEPWRGQGQFAISGSASGTPGAWQASADIRAAALTGPQSIPIRTLEARTALDPRGIEVRSLRASVQDIPLRGRGSWTWDGDGELTADLGPTDLASLPWQAARDYLQGTATATVRARVQRGTLEASGLASLREVSFRGVPVGSGEAEGSLRGGQLHARIGFPQARLAASVSGPLRRDGLLAAEIRLEQAAVEPLVKRFAPQTDAPVAGTATALAELTIPLADPTGVRGTLTLDPLRLVVSGEDWVNRGPVALRWTGSVLTLDRLEVAGRLGNLTASGRYDPRGPLDFTARGRIPLAVLPALRPEILEAGGTLSFTAQIGGTAADPTLRADLVVQDGQFRLRDLAEPLRQVEARAAVTPGALRLVEAAATLGRARLRAGGTLALVSGAPGPYRATITVENLDLNPLQGLRTVWNGDFEVVGRGLQPVVRGEGRLVRGTYTGDLSLLSLLLRDRQEKAASAGPAIPLRLRLHLDDNLLVQANQSRLRVHGTLNLEGTTANPVLFGRIESREGRVFFRKHRWTVVSASARFDDPGRISPVLDAKATALIRSYEVTMQLSGRMDELVVRFSSQPPLPEKQLLALVILGTPDLPSGGAGATALLGEGMQLLIQDLLGADTKSLGLGAIDVRAVEENRETRLQFGAHLGEEARLVYSQPLGGSNKRVLRLEYQILGPVFIAGEQDFSGHYGGDLFVRLRFR